MAQRQIIELVEQATDNLPEPFRLVFVTRVIEGMSVEETSELLDIKPETVKTRLHRARQLVRDQLEKEIGPVLMDAFPFDGRRCQRMTEAGVKRLAFPNNKKPRSFSGEIPQALATPTAAGRRTRKPAEG